MPILPIPKLGGDDLAQRSELAAHFERMGPSEAWVLGGVEFQGWQHPLEAGCATHAFFMTVHTALAIAAEPAGVG